MNKMVTTGIIAGSVISAAGISWIMADKSTRKRLVHGGEKMVKKANKIIDM